MSISKNTRIDPHTYHLSMSSTGPRCAILVTICGIIASGSFGAPLKSHTVNMYNPDPFVLQTYKTGMCFITSWVVILFGERLEFSPFGLISGLLWVTGGVCGIFGITNSGLALSVGTWSCVTVLISFLWGVVVFGEKLNSIPFTLLGIVLLLAGFLGMTFCSSREFKDDDDEEPILETSVQANSSTLLDIDNDLTERLLDGEDPCNSSEREHNARGHEESGYCSNTDEGVFWICGTRLSRRQVGVLGAVMDGLLGGSNLVPMHYSADRGLNYVLSFAIGAACITLLGWIFRLCLNSYKAKSWKIGYEMLPSMYLNKIGHLGIFSGTLWSIGNIGQIYTVSVLGESIGMSIVQSQMIVSGMLGIIWFREIRGAKCITGWIASALLTLMGIFVLSNQHKT